MSQQPPTGPTGTPGASDDDRVPGTPEESGEQPTESFAHSPYDVPQPPSEEETAAYPAGSYAQAPEPGRTIYSEATATEPEPEETGRGRRGWVLPVVIAVVVLLVAGGVALAMLLGGEDEEPSAPAPTETATEEATTAEEEETTAPEEPAEEPTEDAEPAPTEEPTEEATEEPTFELREDLDEEVTVGDLTFALSEDGFTADEDVEGAVEAWRGQYVSGEAEIAMLATLWPDNEAADQYAAQLVEATDGEQVETGHTYTNETGTFWAFLLEDGQGSYIWTTDRGHVLQVTGSTDHVGGFYSAFPL